MKRHLTQSAAAVLVLAGTLGLAACGTSAHAPAATQAQRPNILVIVADDLGYSDLGVFGSEIATPEIDKLAAKGRVLTNCHTSAMCAPTRAMLMSGADLHRVGLGSMPEAVGIFTQSNNPSTRPGAPPTSTASAISRTATGAISAPTPCPCLSCCATRATTLTWLASGT